MLTNRAGLGLGYFPHFAVGNTAAQRSYEFPQTARLGSRRAAFALGHLAPSPYAFYSILGFWWIYTLSYPHSQGASYFWVAHF
jgi:hypothetical protein